MHAGCPLFTARVIRNVKIGPSPKWLVDALEAVGSRSINNVVDVTNFITLELGNPCHVFDLKKLAGNTLIVRFAAKGERVKTLYQSSQVSFHIRLFQQAPEGTFAQARKTPHLPAA